MKSLYILTFIHTHMHTYIQQKLLKEVDAEVLALENKQKAEKRAIRTTLLELLRIIGADVSSLRLASSNSFK